MIDNSKNLRPKPPTLLLLLNLELEAFFEFERQKGRIYKLLDNSQFTESFYDVNIKVINHLNVCVAKYFSICAISEIERSKLLSITHILNQLDLICLSEFNDLLHEIDENFPAEFF